MNGPSEQEEPEHRGKNELENGHEEAALQQLAEARDEEAAQGRDHVSGGALA
jgi:hypothetical protein